MAGMTAEAGAVRLAHGRPFTVDDLEALPDDGNRYELIDGMLVVSPAPGRRHQKMANRLYVVLEAACPSGLDVVGAPFAVRPSASTELQPDVLVGRYDDFTDTHLPTAPVLAVEVVSPSSVINDLNNKKAAYQRMGVHSYWVLDPDEPSLTVFELGAVGVYGQIAVVKGSEAYEALHPYPVRVVPAQLLGRLADSPPAS